MIMKKFLQTLFAFNFLALGVEDGENKSNKSSEDEAAMKQLEGVIEKAIKKTTKELQESYEGKLEESEKSVKGLEEEVSKLKAFANSSKANKEELNEKMEAATVKIFQEVNAKGNVPEAQFEEMKKEAGQKVLAEGDLTPGTDSAAGFNVFEKFETDLIYEIEKFEAIKEFKNITLAKGTRITWTVATNGITATFVDEKGMPTVSEPEFDRVSIDVKKVIALVTITQELEEDQMTTPQLYRLIVEFAGEAIAELLESELLGGTGTGFVGVFNLPAAKTFELAATKTVSDVTEADMLLIEQSLHHRERKKASWIMSDYTKYILYALRDGAGNRIYPNLLDQNPTIGGRKVIVSDYGSEVQDATSNVADASFIAFGNLKKYLIAHRTGVTVDKGFYGDNWAKEMASIKVRKRAGMGSLDDTAFVIASNGAA